jgi:uncharacterized protein
MAHSVPNSVVHLELRTGNLASACAFYARLFGWRAETVHAGSGDYLALALGDRIEGGVVEHDTQQRAFWLPYVQVPDVTEATERARLQGASVCLPPREGPAGWRSVVFGSATGMLALWQPKT